MDKDRKTKLMSRRISAVFSAAFWLFVLLGLRLFQVQVVQARRYTKLAQSEHLEKIVIPAVRGSIFDGGGRLLAMSTRGHSVAAFPQKIADKPAAAAKLAKILGMKQAEIDRLLGDPGAGFVWIERKIGLDKTDMIRQARIPGIEIIGEPTGKRYYPQGNTACHVLGYTGIDDQGLDGVELYYDKDLSGQPGYLTADTDGVGRVLPGGSTRVISPVPGADITLTLDGTIQYIAERELASAVKKSHAKSGTVIVMNPDNGEILAMADYPAFNPEHYDRFSAFDLRNHAISDDYEPGSTFKSVLAAAALDSGKVSMTEKFISSPFIEVGGWKIGNAEDGLALSSPNQNIVTILQDSLNVGAASIALKIGTEPFSEMMKRLGLFNKTGIDLPGEAGSYIPDPRDWQPVQLATIGFGQGVAVTPIQLITAYAAIANGGRMVKPHLVKSISMPDGRVISQPAYPSGARVLKPDTVEKLRLILTQVVKRGTGTNAILPLYDVAGKTGTAQVSENGVYASGAYVASFIGFAPAEKPAFVMLVKVDEPRFPYWGGTVAAPVFREVAKEALWRLQVPPSAGMTRIGAWKSWGKDEDPHARKSQ